MVKLSPQGPHSHILMMGAGPKDLFRSEILAKRAFLGSIVKKQGFFGVVNPSSAHISN